MIANSQGMTIGRVAKAAGVPATTLRYYEREGLLNAPVRTTAGYRMYDDQAVERLRFIRAAQAVGFTLDDIRTLLQLDSHESCGDVQKLLERRIGEVDRKLAELKYMRTALGKALKQCQKSDCACPVLANLSAQSRKGPNSRQVRS